MSSLIFEKENFFTWGKVDYKDRQHAEDIHDQVPGKQDPGRVAGDQDEDEGKPGSSGSEAGDGQNSKSKEWPEPAGLEKRSQYST